METESSLQDITTERDFLSRTPITQEIIINKWDLIKLKKFCTAKKTQLNEEGVYRIRDLCQLSL